MTRGGDISDVTHKTPAAEEQHPGGQVGALCCWEGAPEACVGVWGWGPCQAVPLPLGALFPPRHPRKKPCCRYRSWWGAPGLGSPSRHCHHSKLGSISRCSNFLDVLPPLLLSTAGTTLQLWQGLLLSPMGNGQPRLEGASAKESVDLQPFWHGSTLRLCGQHDPSSLCPPCCLTNSQQTSCWFPITGAPILPELGWELISCH